MPAFLASWYVGRHGIAGLTKTAAFEYAKSGIRVNAICPGNIYAAMMSSFSQSVEDKAAHETACCSMGRHERPSEIGEVAVWLSSANVSYPTKINAGNLHSE